MTESKESMQNTIKNLQARTDNIEKLLQKGNKSIVIQIGSHNIKFGVANKVPYKVRNLIAYKLKTKIESVKKQQHNIQQTNEQEETYLKNITELEQALKAKAYIKPEPKPYKGKPKAKIQVKMKVPERPFKEVSPLFDDHAFWAQQNPEYIVKRPIKYGYFNIQQYTVQQILADLENILVFCLSNKLKIQKKDYPLFSVVLILPDVFCRPHVKGLIQIFLNNLKFKSIYLHLESVLACFGTSISSACVVDIGYQKINICCVDQGIILPGTIIRKNFGGRNINEVLMKQINTNSVPVYNKKNIILNEKNQADIYQIQKLKQKACAINDLEDYSNRIYQLYPIRQGKQEVITLPHTQLLYLAPNCLFSKVWKTLTQHNYLECFDHSSKIFELYEDMEDHFEQFSGGGQIYPACIDNPNYNVQMFQPFIYNELQDMIAYSISNIRDAEFRKKMANSILLIGGTAHLPKLLEQVEDKVFQRLSFYDNTIQRVEIVDLAIKDIAPIYASWFGGAVIPKLDSLRDLWIERNRFVGQYSKQEGQQEEQALFDKKFFTRKQRSQQWGMRYLKQKIPFQW